MGITPSDLQYFAPEILLALVAIVIFLLPRASKNIPMVFALGALHIKGVFDGFRFDVIGTFLGFVFLIIGIGIILLQMALSFFSTGTLPGELWCSLAIQICTWLFLNSGLLFCLARLSSAIRRERVLPNRFTRVMIPAFLFVPVADVFMTLSSLFHGRFLVTLLKRDKWHSE